ncbi:hypothetical protein CHMI_03043 [Cellulomonas hominis]|nr:hypothetical protein CHMI_03043 [Cellulomonas hominis]
MRRVPARPVTVALLLTTALATALTVAGCTEDSPGTADPAPTASASAVPGVTPSATETLLPSPTATGSAVGGLAPGFPADLVAPPEGSEILVSSAEPDRATGLTTISLNLRSPLATADLLGPLRDQLVAAGFVETVVDPGTSGLAATSTFVRGDGGQELLTLGVLDRDGVRTLTLGGTVRL